MNVQALARQIILKHHPEYRLWDEGNIDQLDEIKDIVGLCNEVLEQAACSLLILPVDTKRCNVLLLTTQAWEEAQEQCYEAIKKLKGQ